MGDLLVRAVGPEFEGQHVLNGNCVTSLGPEIVQEFSYTLGTIGVILEGVDDPDLTEVNGGG